jgi:hypothetical protein
MQGRFANRPRVDTIAVPGPVAEFEDGRAPRLQRGSDASAERFQTVT